MLATAPNATEVVEIKKTRKDDTEEIVTRAKGVVEYTK